MVHCSCLGQHAHLPHGFFFGFVADWHLPHFVEERNDAARLIRTTWFRDFVMGRIQIGGTDILRLY